jgi:hypothetical protein
MQENTYVNAVLTNVEAIKSKSSGEGIGYRGFMKIRNEEGRYQFGKAFVVWTRTAAEFAEMGKKVALRRITMPEGNEHTVAYRCVNSVHGYHQDRLVNGKWFQNFVITQVTDGDAPEQVVLEFGDAD